MVLVITTTSLLEIAASSTSSVPSTTSTPPTPPTPSTSSSRCDNSNRAKITPFVSIRLPGRNYEHDCDDNDNDDDDDDDFRHHSPRRGWITVTGREFNLFDTRGGVQETSNKASDNPSILVSKQSRNREDDDTISSTDNHRPHPYYDDIHNSDNDEESTIQAPWAMNAAATNDGTAAARTRPVGLQRQAQTPPLPKQYFRSSAGGVNAAGGATTSGNSGSSGFFKSNNNNNVPKPPIFQSVQEWWTSNISPTIKDWPRIQCRVEPTTTLKIRKTFRPLKTIVRLGADFNTQLGVWQFKSSWEDAIIGGKITLSGRELQLSKSWQLSVGAVEDLVTRLRFRAAVDLQTWKAYARVGFRTERLSPINIMEGFTLLKQLPLDGNRGNVKLEVKANFALPEPEIEYSTESHRSLVGMGDIEVNIDELNLVLDY